ncbi:MAG TPA: hypothetical protein VLO30_04620 [Chthoniobacterales bacterium]|nr:hypothetical protein [Chthoniobacterales bacterium]
MITIAKLVGEHLRVQHSDYAGSETVFLRWALIGVGRTVIVSSAAAGSLDVFFGSRSQAQFGLGAGIAEKVQLFTVSNRHYGIRWEDHSTSYHVGILSPTFGAIQGQYIRLREVPALAARAPLAADGWGIHCLAAADQSYRLYMLAR